MFCLLWFFLYWEDRLIVLSRVLLQLCSFGELRLTIPERQTGPLFLPVSWFPQFSWSVCFNVQSTTAEERSKVATATDVSKIPHVPTVPLFSNGNLNEGLYILCVVRHLEESPWGKSSLTSPTGERGFIICIAQRRIHHKLVLFTATTELLSLWGEWQLLIDI